MNLLEKPIEYLKGVGPQRGELLRKELNIHTIEDLLKHYPFRYQDRSQLQKIAELNPEMPFAQLKGIFTRLELVGTSKQKRMQGLFYDGTDYLEIVWFKGINWVQSNIQLKTTYIIFGKPVQFGTKINMAHPEVQTLSDFESEGVSGLQPVYSTTEKLKQRGLDSRGIYRLIKGLLLEQSFRVTEIFGEELRRQYHLLDRTQAYKTLHLPQSEGEKEAAAYRVKLEEFFFTQLKMLLQKGRRKQQIQGWQMPKVGDYFNQYFKEHLPFELTGAQKRVVKEIHKDLTSGKQMNRLLQGDVGSGKTMVAWLVMLIAADNGFQCCMMAPTEILAQQHYYFIEEQANRLNLTVALLTGSTPAAQRRQLHEDLEKGDLKILLGTHALIEDKVLFNNLGLAIIDEQHRFGVEQRAKLWKKNTKPPHVLVMTATPIPRTLAMTIYGDLDVSIIDEMPKGRKPIQTAVRFESNRLRVFGFLKEQIALGRQVYIVYPLIEESEKMDYQNLMSGYEALLREFPRPQYGISIVHGRMKADEKEFEMKQFVEGKTHIMVATSVIEVGVNVPNASVMVIESAEKFGLSQLHQLRGRVGRGSEQSYCILLAGYKLSKVGRKRLDAMAATNNGFEIADLDLKLRGPGEISGLRQSGITNLKLADISQDQHILKLSRHLCEQILQHDPQLEKPENQSLFNELKRTFKGTDFSSIS